MPKSDRHAAIRARAARAIADLYHNATPDYPRSAARLNDADGARFQSWFDDMAQFEIEYINDGGAYAPSDAKYRALLECNAATRWPGDAAPGSREHIKRAYYVRHGMRAMQLERDANPYARWERITEYGEVGPWGRGGRTLAPKSLVEQMGGSRFRLREFACESGECQPIASVVELVRIVEAFNAYVESWCRGVPEMWREQEEARIAEEEYERATMERERDDFYAGM